MKIDRLIGIISILLQQENITAPVLAEKFEVSRRTINRDIDSLCQAGIPIVTKQGINGGISIMSGYKMDKTLLTTKEMQSILAGLKGLDSISGKRTYSQLIEKLSLSDDEVLHSNEHILIDLASWYKSSLTPKIELMQTAISNQEKIRFTYYSRKGESIRLVEPYQLIFKWASWYLWGYCNTKKEFRLFKLNRIDDLCNTAESFELRTMPYPDLSAEYNQKDVYQVKIRFSEGLEWRLIEEFGKDSYVKEESGTLLFSFGFSGKQSLFEWLVTYGSKAELIEPKELREEFAKITKAMYQIYEKKGNENGQI